MNHTNTPGKGKKNNETTKRNAGIAIGILLLIAILLAAFRGCENDKPIIDNPVESGPGIVYDDSAVEGGWK